MVLRLPFTSRETACVAESCPVRLTPSPFSVPTMVIRFAYIPPISARSMAYCGAVDVVSEVMGEMLPSFAMLFCPATIFA